MARTKTDLITAVATKLRISGLGDTPAAEEAAIIRQAYDDKLEQWREMGLVYWTNTDNATQEIPNIVFPMMVMLVANWVAPDFGKGSATDAITMEEALLIPLRRHMAKPPSGEPTSFTDY